MPKAIQPEIPFNDSEDILKRVKESGICWFESNNGRQPPVTEMRITHAVRVKLSGHVNDDNIRALDNSSSRFLHQIISPKQPTLISPS